MKNYFLAIVSLLVAFNLSAQNQTKKFFVKSGVIEYTLKGNTIGTKTIMFDDYGDKYYEREKGVTETKIFGITDRVETDKLLIMIKDKVWHIDYISGENQTGINPFYNINSGIVGNKSEAELQKMADDILKEMGGEKLGKETVLGKSCDKVSVLGTISWLYKGVILKSEAAMMGIKLFETATRFDENASVPASTFIAPTHLEYQEIQLSPEMYTQEIPMTEEEIDTPLTYSYSKFQSVVNTFKPDGYAVMMVLNEGGEYIAMLNQGMESFISVMLSNYYEVDLISEEMQGFEAITHNGKTCYYGDWNEGEMTGKAIMIPFREHNVMSVIMASPAKDKNSILKLADRLKL
jgi:hypothetical protein